MGVVTQAEQKESNLKDKIDQHLQLIWQERVAKENWQQKYENENKSLVEKENEIFLIKKVIKDKDLEIVSVKNKLDMEIELRE